MLTKFRRARNMSRVLARGDAFRLAFGATSPVARPYAAPALGAPLYLRPGTVDAGVLEKVFLHAEYELPFSFAPRRIVDAGAHIGLASRFFAHRHPEAKIFAIEPDEANLAVLRRNAEMCPQIEVRPGALWSRATALVGSGRESWSNTVREAAGGGASVRGLTIPEILERTGWDRIDLLKLDIEGAEREVFCDDAAAWLPLVRLIVIELHDRFQPGCSRAFYRQVADRLEAQEVRGENVFALLRE